MKKFLLVLLLITAMSTIVQATTFEDVEGLNCQSAVESLEHIGIVNGIALKEYAPKKSVTRAELSKMIVNALKVNTLTTKSFSDIKDHWGEAFIQQAAEIGILKGYHDGTFQPDREVSYAEAIAILVRSLGYENLENSSEKWYDYYISQMQKIHLNEGMESVDVEAFANRGDIAILLWNTIKSNKNGKSLLEKNFSEYSYFEGEKITEINNDNGRIFYRTPKFYFYIDNNIHFSDLGGMASGFLDKTTLTVKGLEIDSGRNLKKISGMTKELNQSGYDIFNCNDISGYGMKEKANYVEIFVNQDTNQTERVVYYDTTQSHFADSIKIGISKIKMDSKDVYDTSVIVHKGQTITQKVLRTETVKEINSNALLVYDGKVVSWTTIPGKVVVREIKKDLIYTYIHEYADIDLDVKSVDKKKLVIDGKTYPFSEECIAENVKTETAAKFHEALSLEDLRLIAEKDEKIRVYFNELHEIVKFEFSYDVWKIREAEVKEAEYQELEPELKKIGIISDFDWILSTKEEDSMLKSKIVSLPSKESFNYKHKDGEFKVGDFVYLTETEKKTDEKKTVEKKLNKISESITLGNLKIVSDYSGYIDNERLGEYRVTKDTQYIEVLLKRSKQQEGEYSECTMTMIDSSYLGENTKYKKMHLILDQDNVVLRVYAFKEIGITFNIGIVKNIEAEKSGDTITSNKIYIIGENKGTRRYHIQSADDLSIGDLITYETKKAVKNKEDDDLIVNEVYRHQFIGNSHDLVVDNDKNHLISFQNSNDVLDLNDEIFKIGNKVYELEEYVLLNAEVTQNTETGEWIFKYYSLPTKKNLKAVAGSRFVIDELTKIIVVYAGYKE